MTNLTRFVQKIEIKTVSRKSSKKFGATTFTKMTSARTTFARMTFSSVVFNLIYLRRKSFSRTTMRQGRMPIGKQTFSGVTQ